jgi:RES domain-containing protein
MQNSTGKSGTPLAVSRVDWFPCYRAMPGETDGNCLFSRLASPSHWEALERIEAITNPLARRREGSVCLLPQSAPAGEYLALVARLSFVLVRGGGTRFDDGAAGAWYGAASIMTAIAEVIPHREKFLAATNEAPGNIQLTIYSAILVSNLHDLRGRMDEFPELSMKDQTGPAQELASSLRHTGSQGIVYESDRDPGGECVALFRTDILRDFRLVGHVRCIWDGVQIVKVLAPGEAGDEDEWVQIWP